MQNANQPPEPELNADQLARLAEMLNLDIAAEDLLALSKQLSQIEALEQSELGDYAPILKMNASWHD